MPELAVILATYNEADNLGQLVEALEGLGEDLQIVVVDDDSPTGQALSLNSCRFDSATLS